MTLSLTMGLTIGLRRTFWMMWGELAGVGIVAISAAVGIAALMLEFPQVFTAFKWVGGLYLGWLGVQMWRSRGKMAIRLDNAGTQEVSRRTLALQGFVTAISNPKGWAFFATLLPPFLDAEKAMEPQIASLVVILLSVEFLCLILYASGGRSMRHFLEKSGNVRMMNRIAGTLMIGVGFWLALG